MENMSRVMHLKDIEKKIEEIAVKIANEADQKMKEKLEQELEYLNDLKMFVVG